MIDPDRLPGSDPGPLLESPFESVSNRPFHALLAAGAVLLGVVALVGRNPVTAAVVVCYLAAIPTYVAVRVRRGGEDDAAGPDESDDGTGEDADGSDGADGESVDVAGSRGSGES